MVPHRRLRRAALSALVLSLVLSSGAGARDMRAVGYGAAHGYGGGYGFAEEAVRGAYVGAPFSSLPSPNRLVPAPWSYGTYGIPTLSGIRETPAAVPSLTVINPGVRAPSRPIAGARILSRDTGGEWAPAERDAAGVRVIAVTVPRR